MRINMARYQRKGAAKARARRRSPNLKRLKAPKPRRNPRRRNPRKTRMPASPKLRRRKRRRRKVSQRGNPRAKVIKLDSDFLYLNQT